MSDGILVEGTRPAGPVVLVTTGELGLLYRVTPETAARWCAAGFIEGAKRSPGRGPWCIPISALPPGWELVLAGRAPVSPADAERTDQ